MPIQLKVLARGDALVLDQEFARVTKQRRYIGRSTVSSWDEHALPEGEPRHIAANHWLPPGEKPLPHFAYPKTGAPETVPADVRAPEYSTTLSHYAQVIRDGGLWPADAQSAAHCGVPFDPTFGGEYAAKER